MADPGQTAVAREIHRIASHPIPRRAGSATPQPRTAGWAHGRRRCAVDRL